jgi:ATP-dependent Zn protease
MASVAAAIGAAAATRSVAVAQQHPSPASVAIRAAGPVGRVGARSRWISIARPRSRSRRGVAAVRAATPGDAGAAAGVSARETVTLGGASRVCFSSAASAQGRRAVLCRAKKPREDVGFNYDDFDDFVGTGSSRSGSKSSKKKKAKDVAEDSGEEIRWSQTDPPPDPRFGPLPDALSFANPLFPNRIEEAKALKAQRAWARAVWEEQGKFPSRTSMVKVRDKDRNVTERQITEKEHERALDRYLDVYARADRTYPQVLNTEPKLDPYRLREKIGMKPSVEREIAFPELLDFLQAGQVGRLLQYDQGRTVIIEMSNPGNEVAGPKTKTRYECKVPGDVHWDLTKFAYMNRNGHYDRQRPEHNKTAMSQFMCLNETNEPFVAMLPTIWPMIAMTFLATWFKADAGLSAGRKVGRKKQLPVVKWLNKHVFRGQLTKKAPKADMMEEFGKSKAKMIGGKDTDKDGKFQKLSFEDVAGVDHIVEEFRVIISTMKEFKEYQENLPPERKGAGNRPPEGFHARALRSIPKPGTEEYAADPDGWVEEKMTKEEEEMTEQRARLTIPKGILFEGPPGTGKTLLAKAVAGEAGVPFFYANGSEFVEMFVGVAAKRVRDLFKRAREVSPSIIFIDELDTIGRSRSLYGNRDSATLEREAGLMQMLVELDGFDTKAGAGRDQEMVLVMGATNLSSQLDPALLRSGRFEKSFHIGVPRRHEDRLGILKVHARKLNVPTAGNAQWESDALLNRTAELTDGYSGASLAALLNEAAILSVRADREEVNLDDIEKVIERNLVGVSSAPMEDGWGKDHRAMVEAGRAVLWSSKRSENYCPDVLRVTIKPYGEQMTGIMLMPDQDSSVGGTENGVVTLDQFIDGLAMLLAGRCVETVFFGPQGVSIQTKGDLVAAADVAYDIVQSSGVYPDASKFAPSWPDELVEHFQIPAKGMEDGVYDLMVRAHIRAEEYVNYYKPVILQVASELLAHGSLYGSHVRDLVEDHEVKMRATKDAELAGADREAADEEQRRRKEEEHEREEAERRAREAEEAAAAAKALAEESDAGVVDVDVLPLPGTPPQILASDAEEAAAMDAADAKRAAEDAGRRTRDEGEGEGDEEKAAPDPFDAARQNLAAAAAEAQAVTDAETAAREEEKKKEAGEDGARGDDEDAK